MESLFNQIAIMLTKFPSYLPFGLIILLVAVFMYRAHVSSDDKFSVFDLIQDKDTGKGSLEKIAMLSGYLSLTWWFIDLAASDRATVEDAIAYGGIMGLSKAYNSWLSAKYNTNKSE